MIARRFIYEKLCFFLGFFLYEKDHTAFYFEIAIPIITLAL
jgi:hypothetical protein